MAMSTTFGAAACQVHTAMDEERGAAYHISGRLGAARWELGGCCGLGDGRRAIHAKRVGTLRIYVDGNRNGILTRDIQRGVDRLDAPLRRFVQSVSR